MPRQRDLVIGTAGHIDHGKTALVRALTGVDTDRLPAEKQRGITIDLGFASLEIEGQRLALVDVPGHERFIRNMLAGASGLDLALLVVAADDSVMPQTREHLEILEILGLPSGLVVLTKCDLVDPGWLDLVEDDVRALVAGTFLDSTEILRTSSTTGLGIEALKSSLARLCEKAPDRDDPGLFRLAIDRSFTLAGHGTVVTGTVASGEVAVGDDLELFPAGRMVRVRGLHRHDRPVDRVGRGARAAINLAGVHHAEVVRGHELATPGYLTSTRILSVEVQASAEASRPLRHRGRYRVHLGTAEVSATLSILEEIATNRTLAQLILAEPVATVHGQPFVIREESPPATLGGGRVLVPVARRRIRRRDRAEIDRLKRLSGLDVSGGATITPHPGPPPQGGRGPEMTKETAKPLASSSLPPCGGGPGWGVQDLATPGNRVTPQRLATSDPSTRIAAALAGYGLASWTDRTLVRDSGVAISDVAQAVSELEATGALIPLAVGPRRTARVLAEVVEALEGRVLRAVARLHEATPRFSAIARARVASALADLENDALVASLIDRLKRSGKLVADARSVALAGYEPKLSQAERKLKREMAEAYRTGGFAPPDPSDWVVKGNPKSSTVADLLALLVDEEQIVEIGPSLYLDRDAELALRRKVADRLTAGGSLTMAELRDLMGTSRKFAVPIGEYLDRIGWTRREGDVRTLGDRAVASPPVEERPAT